MWQVAGSGAKSQAILFKAYLNTTKNRLGLAQQVLRFNA